MKGGQSTFMTTYNITYDRWSGCEWPVALLKSGGTKLYVHALLQQSNVDTINVDSKIHSADEHCEATCKLLFPNSQYNIVDNLTGPLHINWKWSISKQKDLYEYNLSEVHQ